MLPSPPRLASNVTPLTVIGVPDPGLLTPANLPAASYTATLWKSLARIEIPLGGPLSASPPARGRGRKVPHTRPLTPGWPSRDAMGRAKASPVPDRSTREAAPGGAAGAGARAEAGAEEDADAGAGSGESLGDGAGGEAGAAWTTLSWSAAMAQSVWYMVTPAARKGSFTYIILRVSSAVPVSPPASSLPAPPPGASMEMSE